MPTNQSFMREFDFTLPKGLIDEQGNVHRQGVMRLATAKDEICVQADRRVQSSSAYGVLVMLSRVIERLGDLPEVTPEHLENLFTLDIAYLREFYNRINQHGAAQLQVQCPKCANDFKVELALAGEP
ncbi:MAG: phage tail assembly protein [Leptolyngbyaceae cyanobacterium bins.302]|nr:phage tail assembly protein [Leptolyngbyaceae cyanobacterium bins.302]